MRKIIIFLCHYNKNSFCYEIANSYKKSAARSGCEVKLLNIYDMNFDPVLRHGYEVQQLLENDLKKAQENILWADHLVFIYPIWWGSMPAILKGFFDRTFLPGFSFRYVGDKILWEMLLKNKSAHVITTMDTPNWVYKFLYNSPGHNQIKKTILEFCGVKPIKVMSFSSVKKASFKKRKSWLKKIETFAKL